MKSPTCQIIVQFYPICSVIHDSFITINNKKMIQFKNTILSKILSIKTSWKGYLLKKLTNRSIWYREKVHRANACLTTDDDTVSFGKRTENFKPSY